MRTRICITLSIILLFGPLIISSFNRLPAANAASSEPSSLALAYFYISEGFLEWAPLTLNRETMEGELDSLSNEEQVEVLFILALMQEAIDDPAGAKTYYEELIASPNVSAVHKDLAVALLGELELNAGNVDKAQGLLEQVNESLPGQARVVYALGQIAEIAGDLESAITKYQEASEISRDWLLPIVQSASLHNRQGAYDEAAQLLFDAEFLGLRDVNFHLELARALLGLYDARSADPDLVLDASLKERLGWEGEDPDTALLKMIHHSVDRMLQLSPDHPDAMILLQGIPTIP